MFIFLCSIIMSQICSLISLGSANQTSLECLTKVLQCSISMYWFGSQVMAHSEISVGLRLHRAKTTRFIIHGHVVSFSTYCTCGSCIHSYLNIAFTSPLSELLANSTKGLWKANGVKMHNWFFVLCANTCWRRCKLWKPAYTLARWV